MRELAFDRDCNEGYVMSPYGFGVVALDMAGRCRELAHSTPLSARVACAPSCAAVVDGKGREYSAVGELVPDIAPKVRMTVGEADSDQVIIDAYRRTRNVADVVASTGKSEKMVHKVLSRNNVPIVSARRPV
jgi:hypothetical protein